MQRKCRDSLGREGWVVGFEIGCMLDVDEEKKTTGGYASSRDFWQRACSWQFEFVAISWRVVHAP